MWRFLLKKIIDFEGEIYFFFVSEFLISCIFQDQSVKINDFFHFSVLPFVQREEKKIKKKVSFMNTKKRSKRKEEKIIKK